MRSLAIAAIAAFGSLALAQSPLTTTFAGGNSGNVGNGVFFNLTVNTTVTINQFNINCDAINSGVPAGTAGSLDVWLGPNTWVGNTQNAALWTMVASGPLTSAANNVPTTVPLTTPFALGPGTYAMGLHVNSVAHAYTNGNGSNQIYSNAELTLSAGGAQNVFLSPTSPTFTPRVFNGSIFYTLGGTPIQVASYQPYGSGCYGFYTSFYELFPSTAAGYDLSNTSMTLTLNGAGYTVTSGGGTFVPPTSPDLLLADDAVSVQTLPFPILYPQGGTLQSTTQLEISSNGCVSPAGTNGTSFNPTVAAFLSGAPRWCNWHDFDPSIAGASTHIDIDLVSSLVYVTWVNVPDSGITGGQLSTWQLVLSAAGNVEFRWQTMSLSGGGTWPTLVGWTPGGGALDPGNRDLSAPLAFSTQAADNPPLGLTMDNRPLLGTTPNLIATDIPAGTGLGAMILSFTQHNPGIDLTAFGMPGCFQYVGLDVTFILPISGNSASFPFAIPSSTSFNGLQIFTQSGTFSSGFNPLGVLSSNGLQMTLGSL